MSSRREGVVLVVAVLVILAVAMISTGMLFVSTQAASVARASEASLRMRAAAEGAVRRVVAEWDARRYRDMAPGSIRAVPGGPAPEAGASVSATVERLSGNLFLVRGTGENPVARAGAAALVRSIGIGEVWREFPAAITTSGDVIVEAGATVTGTAVGDPTDAAEPPDAAAAAVAAEPLPDEPVEACPAEAVDTVQALFGSVDRPAVLRTPTSDGSPAPVARARLGPLDAQTLRGLAAPAADGEPSLRMVVGNAEVGDGVGAGILVVEGDLTLSGSARFNGAILVTGRMTVVGNAEVRGAVHVLGTGVSRVGADATVTYDACALWRAFSLVPALRGAFAPEGRLWIPVP